MRTAPVVSLKSVLKTAAGGTKGGDAGKWHLLSPRWLRLTHGWQPHQADLLIKRSASLSFSLSAPFTPATWSCVKGLGRARVGMNSVRDRDIAGGFVPDCDREETVAVGASKRERPHARVRSKCEWHCINSLSHLLHAGVHQLSTLLTSLTHKHSAGLLHTYTHTRHCLKLMPGLSSILQKRWQKRMSSKCAADSYAWSVWWCKDNVWRNSPLPTPSVETNTDTHTHQYV